MRLLTFSWSSFPLPLSCLSVIDIFSHRSILLFNMSPSYTVFLHLAYFWLLPITNYRLQITDYWLQTTDYRYQTTNYRTDYRLPITDFRYPITDYRQPITDYLFHYWLLITLPITDYIANNRLPIFDCAKRFTVTTVEKKKTDTCCSWYENTFYYCFFWNIRFVLLFLDIYMILLLYLLEPTMLLL